MIAPNSSLVLKIGSATLIGTDGFVRQEWLAALAEDIAELHAHKVRVTLVTSGAVAMGRHVLGYGMRALTLEEKQAAAAAGQAPLLHRWVSALQGGGAYEPMQAAQILLTAGDLIDRRRYLNARNTFETLLATPRVVPIVNENDTVATAELRFGDNDRLAARVAQMVGADTLVLLSDIDGLYTHDPRADEMATHIAHITDITPEIEAMAGGTGTAIASGGMATKIEAAKIATSAGCSMIIMNGNAPRPLLRLRQGERHTLFTAHDTPFNARKRWIGGSLHASGVLVIDSGAAAALKSGKSLLPAGVKAVEGEFARGDAVWIKSAEGDMLGKGLCAYGSEEARRIIGRKSGEIAAILGYKGRDVMIHRDDMALTP